MKTKIPIFFILLLLGAFNTYAQELLSRIVEDGGSGKYTALMLTEPSLPTHTIFRPKDMDKFGRKSKLPIIAWGNGGCFNSPWEHVNFLNEVASHGFLVIAIGTMPMGGEEIRDPSNATLLTDAIDWAIAQHSDKDSPYYGKIDTANIAVSGMSCGGLQTLTVAADPRITTIGVFNSGIFKQPREVNMPGIPQLTKADLKQIHTPTLYLLGGPTDIAYENGMDDFEQIDHVPIFVGNLDVGHGGTYRQKHGGEFARVATAWYQWQLKGDKKAGKLFIDDSSGLAQAEGWTVDKKNIGRMTGVRVGG